MTRVAAAAAAAAAVAAAAATDYPLSLHLTWLQFSFVNDANSSSYSSSYRSSCSSSNSSSNSFVYIKLIPGEDTALPGFNGALHEL